MKSITVPKTPRQLTPHHAKYDAHDLTRRAPAGLDRLSTALFDASVDLNPHQIEAALFALQSPLSKGADISDERDSFLHRLSHPLGEVVLAEAKGFETPEDTWKVRLLEEGFHRLMFDTGDV